MFQTLKVLFKSDRPKAFEPEVTIKVHESGDVEFVKHDDVKNNEQ